MLSLQLYNDSLPNEFRITIVLEGLGLPYTLHHVRIDHGGQRHPEFLRLNPHGQTPVLIDRAVGITLFESAAILQYLAKVSKRLLPDAPRERWEALAQLTFYASSTSPIPGQHVHFEIFAEERYPPAIERYRRLSEGVFAILDQCLAGRPWLVGKQYSVAGIATFSWTHTARIVDFDFSHYHHLDDWHRRMALWPAVQRGIVLPEPAMGP